MPITLRGKPKGTAHFTTFHASTGSTVYMDPEIKTNLTVEYVLSWAYASFYSNFVVLHENCEDYAF